MAQLIMDDRSAEFRAVIVRQSVSSWTIQIQSRSLHEDAKWFFHEERLVECGVKDVRRLAREALLDAIARDITAEIIIHENELNHDQVNSVIRS